MVKMEPYQTIKIWMKSYWKFKLLVAVCKKGSMAEMFDEVVEDYAKKHQIDLKVS